MRPPVEQGQRVRVAIHYPRRGVFCPAVTWTYEGVVDRVISLEENARQNGSGWQASRYRGEYHVRLADATMTPDPATPLRRPEHRDVVTLTGDAGRWEVIA